MSAIERRAAETKRDEDFLAERKAHAAKNLEKTNRLRAQRLAHEATLDAPVKKPKKPAKKAQKRPKLAVW